MLLNTFKLPMVHSTARFSSLALMLLLFFSVESSAQTLPFNEFVAQVPIGGDVISERVRSLRQTRDAGFIAVAERSDGLHEYQVVKLQPDGQLSWLRTIFEDGHYWPRAIRQSDIGNDGYVVAGIMHEQTAYPAAMLTKLQPDATVTWVRHIQGLYGAGANDVEVLSAINNHDYVTVGFSDNNNAQIINGGPVDLLVARVNASAALQWSGQFNKAHPFDGWHHTYGKALVETHDNKLMVTGDTQEPGGASRIFLQQLDANGLVGWGREYDFGFNNCFAFDLELTSDNGFIIVGEVHNTNHQNTDIALIKVSAIGAFEWGHVLGTSHCFESGYAVDQAPDGGYFITGYTNLQGFGGLDLLALKTDATGSVEWAKAYGNINDDVGYSTQVTNDGRFAIGGYSHSNPTDDLFLLNIDNTECIRRANCNEIFINIEDLGDLNPSNIEMFVYNTPQLGNAAGGRQDPDEVLTSADCPQCFVVVDKHINFQANYGNFYDRGSAGLEDADGNLVAVGWAQEHVGLATDIFMIKSDAQGQLIWSQEVFQSNGIDDLLTEEYAYDVKETSDGGYILAGDVEPQPQQGIPASDSDGLIVRMNNAGAVQWAWSYGQQSTGAFDRLREIQPVPDAQSSDGNGYVAVGWSKSGSIDYDMWVVKLRGNGTVEWAYKYDSDDVNDYAMSIFPVDDEDADAIRDDGYIVAGYTISEFGGSGIGGSKNDIYVVRLNSSGDVLWARVYGHSSRHDYAQSIVQSDDDGDGVADDGFILTGYTEQDNFNNDVYVLKLDRDGIPQWDGVYDVSESACTYSDDRGRSVQQWRDGGFVIAGYTCTAEEDDQALLMKFDGCGLPIWQSAYPDVQPGDGGIHREDHGEDLIIAANGDLLLTGSTCSYSSGGGVAEKGDIYFVRAYCNGGTCKTQDLSSLSETGQSRLTALVSAQRINASSNRETDAGVRGITKLQHCICNALECPSAKESAGFSSPARERTKAQTMPTSLALRIGPNPNSQGNVTGLRIDNPESQQIEVTLSSVLGERIYRTEEYLPAGESALTLPTAELPQGVYILALRTAGAAIHQMKLIIR